MSSSSKKYINASNAQGLLDADFATRMVDIPEHDGSTKGLKLGGVLVTKTATQINTLLANVVEDTSPTLGGDLDLAGNALMSPDTTDFIEIPNGSITLNTNSVARLTINDSGIMVNSLTLNDTSNNELLKFAANASAVNEVTINNNVTGSPPIIESTGGDTNVSLNLRAKGTGAVNVMGTATASAEIRLAEDTDNGNNYIGLKAPASVASNVTFTLPSADSATSGHVLKTDAAGTLSLAAYDIVLDTTPQLGGHLDVNGFDITSPDGTDKIDIVNGTIEIETNNVVRIDITDSGTRLGATGARVTQILDEDAMGSNSDTSLCTQQSIKAYVDTQLATKIANVVEDTTPQLGGDLDLNGNQITSPDGTDLIDIPNGSINLQTNSVSRLDISDSGVRLGAANARVTTILDEDAMGSDSATALATQQSIKAYADSLRGCVKISTATASSSATLSFTGLTSTYKNYMLVCDNLLPATDAVSLHMQLGTGGTPTYGTGVSDYSWCFNYARVDSADATSEGVSGDYNDSKIYLADVGTGTSEDFCGVIYLFDPASATSYKKTTCNGAYIDSAPALLSTLSSGIYKTATAVTAVRLQMSSGNIASGTITLYGLL